MTGLMAVSPMASLRSVDDLPLERCLKSALCAGLAMAMLATAMPAQAQSQAEMNTQADRDFARADKQLNAAYAALLATISADGKTSLRDAERAWLAFRDKECAFESLGSAGGSVQPMVIAQCRQRLTEARIKDIEQQSHCEEGDVACGHQ